MVMNLNSCRIKSVGFTEIMKYHERRAHFSCHDFEKKNIIFDSFLNASQTHDVPYNGRSRTTKLQGDVESLVN